MRVQDQKTAPLRSDLFQYTFFGKDASLFDLDLEAIEAAASFREIRSGRSVIQNFEPETDDLDLTKWAARHVSDLSVREVNGKIILRDPQSGDRLELFNKDRALDITDLDQTVVKLAPIAATNLVGTSAADAAFDGGAGDDLYVGAAAQNSFVQSALSRADASQELPSMARADHAFAAGAEAASPAPTPTAAEEDTIELPVLVHETACCCPVCMGSEADTADNSAFDDPEFLANAVGTIDEMADYLQYGYWEATDREARFFNIDIVDGFADNNGVLLYNLSGFTAEESPDDDFADPDGLTESRRELVRHAFDYYEAVLGIDFEETTSTDFRETDFYFFDTELSRAFATSSVIPMDGENIFSMINIGADFSSEPDTFDTYHFRTILHEIGHALGLGHLGDYNASDPDRPGVVFANDHWDNSAMSYLSQTRNPTYDQSYAFLQTLSVADLHALQNIYGAQGYGPSAAFQGNTVYGFNTNISADVSAAFSEMALYADNTVYTIADGSGYDTLDFSGYGMDMSLDLTITRATDTSATMSTLGPDGRVFLGVDVEIERAIAGSGNDRLLGNEKNNELNGRAGDDTLDGGAGDDILYGASGNDVFFDSAGNDRYVAGSGIDTINFLQTITSYSFTLSDQWIRVIDTATDLVSRTMEWFAFSDVTYAVEDLTYGLSRGGFSVDDVFVTNAANGSGFYEGGQNLLSNDDDYRGRIVAVNGDAGNVGTYIDHASGAGRININADGRFDFTASGGFDDLFTDQSETISFNYTVRDDFGTSTATLDVEVFGTLARGAINDYLGAFSEDEAGGVYNQGNVLANDTGLPDMTVTQVNGVDIGGGRWVDLSGGGRVFVNANGRFDFDADGDFDFLKDGQSRQVSFDYTMRDGAGNTDVGTATLDVTGIGAAIATNDQLTFSEAADGRYFNRSNLLANDTGTGDLSITHVNGVDIGDGRWVDLSDGGRVFVNAEGRIAFNADGDFDFLKDGQSRQVSFDYTMRDGAGDTDVGTASLDVTGIGAAIANDDEFIFSESADGRYFARSNLLDNDTGTGDLSITHVNGVDIGDGRWVDLSDGGRVFVNAEGRIAFNADGDFDNLNDGQSRQTTFDYTLRDAEGDTDLAIAIFTVTGEDEFML